MRSTLGCFLNFYFHNIFRNPTGIEDTTFDHISCLSTAGIPMNPFVVVGGFIPENQEGGFPENPGILF